LVSGAGRPCCALAAQDPARNLARMGAWRAGGGAEQGGVTRVRTHARTACHVGAVNAGSRAAARRQRSGGKPVPVPDRSRILQSVPQRTCRSPAA
jgi:hypothetical protein